MALEMKKIPHQLVNVKKYMDKNGFTKEYEKINPTKLIPALFIDGHWITETMAIIEYIEETRPYEPRILPKDFFQRAVSRRIAESVNSGIQPL
jgi:maleylacetoacetate isomerase